MSLLQRLAAWWTRSADRAPDRAPDSRPLTTEELDHVGNGSEVRRPGETEEARDTRMEAITRSRVQS